MGAVVPGTEMVSRPDEESFQLKIAGNNGIAYLFEALVLDPRRPTAGQVRLQPEPQCPLFIGVVEAEIRETIGLPASPTTRLHARMLRTSPRTG